MNLDTPLIQRLRDHLIEQSRRSMEPLHGGRTVEPGSEEEDAVLDRFRPFGELLFLVASADGRVHADEQALMMGAFRVLTAGRVGGEVLLALETELRAALEAEGMEGRLEVVCNALSRDREDAELALSLAGALALADSKLEAAELRIISQLTSWLGISPRRADELLSTGRRSLPPRPPA